MRLALTSIFVLLLLGPAAASDTLVAGQVASATSPAATHARRTFLTLVDPTIDLAGIDPTVSGATLELFGQPGGGLVTLALPPEGWRRVSGKRPRFRFANPPQASLSVLLEAGRRIRIAMLRDDAYVLADPQGSLAARITIGTVRFCALFGGRVIVDNGTHFLARRAAAPTECPLAPGETAGECNLAADCPATGNECIAPTCVDHVCGTQNLGAAHTLSTGQSAGDCQKIVCNGAGGTTSADDPTDLPTSSTACLINPSCDGSGGPMTPAFDAAPTGTTCTLGGGTGVCGDTGTVFAGSCVACNVAADCADPNPGNECVAASCVDHVCGTQNLGAAHTLSTGQSAGDCQKIVCNGAGGTTSADDPTDLPTSSTACLINPSCDGSGGPMTPAFDPAPTGTTCTLGGGTGVCGDTGTVFAGSCVACNVDQDCASGQTCSGAHTCSRRDTRLGIGPASRPRRRDGPLPCCASTTWS